MCECFSRCEGLFNPFMPVDLSYLCSNVSALPQLNSKPYVWIHHNFPYFSEHYRGRLRGFVLLFQFVFTLPRLDTAWGPFLVCPCFWSQQHSEQMDESTPLITVVGAASFPHWSSPVSTHVTHAFCIPMLSQDERSHCPSSHFHCKT